MSAHDTLPVPLDEPDCEETHDFSTLSVHAGQEKDPLTGSRAVPIYATASYTFESAEHAASLFAGETPGNQYGRMHNPTVEVFVRRLVALEAGAAGLALSSGQAATTAALLALARPGGHLVVSNECFGGTFAVLRKVLEPWGCAVSTVSPAPDAVQETIRDETIGVWVETIANPSGSVPDIAALAERCRAARVPLIVDNTWGCGGYLCRPLELGADIVVHSATKWIGGHGTFVGGAVVEAGALQLGRPAGAISGVRHARFAGPHLRFTRTRNGLYAARVRPGTVYDGDDPFASRGGGGAARSGDAAAPGAAVVQYGARAGGVARGSTRHQASSLSRPVVASLTRGGGADALKRFRGGAVV